MQNSLIRNQGFINGVWQPASDGAEFPVVNPATGEQLIKVADLSGKDTSEAIDAAHRAFFEWRQTSARERAMLLRQWSGLIRENRDELANLITLEQGKPLAESYGEISYGVSFIDWFAEEARRVYGDVIPAPMLSASAQAIAFGSWSLHLNNSTQDFAGILRLNDRRFAQTIDTRPRPEAPANSRSQPR